ncbi:MAG: acetyl-CoA C-acetyltransferase, partial [Alphaproteobacteria bacterium]
MTEAYIYDTPRTPRGRGKKDGSLHEITPIQLATQMLEAVRDRTGIDTNLIDDVVLGCVAPVGEQGADIARVAALNAGFAETVAGFQINRFCASGLEAVNIAAAKVISGEADFVIGGGVESMSRVPMMSDGGAWPVDPAVAFKTYFVPQGISADLIATKYGYSRDDVDAYSVESQKRAEISWKENRFKNSIVPVKDVIGRPVLDHDEYMRPETDMQSLASLNPSFKDLGDNYGFSSVALQKYPEFAEINHVHHAGNSSGIVDGSGMVLVGSKEAGEKAGLKPRARMKAFASVGSEPTIMLTAPSYAAEKAMKKAGMKKSDIDLWEI